LLELTEQELPPMRLFAAYQKLHLYVPYDLGYMLACKLVTGRPKRESAAMALFCQALGIQNRVQAHHLVNRYFPSPLQQAFYRLPHMLERIFGE
jgi:hypothetical protein